MRFCTHCGQAVPDSCQFCTACGRELRDAPVQQPRVPRPEPAYEDDYRDELPPQVPPKQSNLPLILLVALLALLLIGVAVWFFLLRGADGDDDASGAAEQTEQTAGEPAITFAPDTPVAASVAFDRKTESGAEYAVITGTDATGKALWKVETPHYGVSQLARVTGLDVRNNVYYYIDDGDVVTLSLADGSEVWRNKDFKGSPASEAWTFDANGTLYLCGYLGPDLVVINTQGKTLYRYAQFHSDYYWPYRLQLLEGGGAQITYEMGPGEAEGILTVNVQTGEVLGAENSSGGADAATDPTAVGVTLSASSTLQEKGQDHSPQCAKDGNRATAWVEGGSSFDGWLKLDLATPTALNGLHIWSGYHKSQDLFYKNNRPHRISVMVEYDGGAQNFQFDLNDSMDVQTISFGENCNQVKITSITITIQSVYPGSKYNDTCISEIQLY